MTTIDELFMHSRLSPRLLAEVENQCEHMMAERRAASEGVRMGSFAEDGPFHHFLHASHHEQVRVAQGVLGVGLEEFEATS